LRNAEISIFLFIMGLLGVNWPILEIFHASVAVYLFTFWLIFIVATALYSNSQKDVRKKT